MKANIVVIICFLIPFMLNCQVIDEGFESGDFTAYNWVLSGNAEWFVTDSYPFEGDYCAQGGNVADNQNTTIAVDIEFPYTGILAFAWKVSSEANYDYLRFYLDDVMLAEISGTVAWTQIAYELGAGTHNLRWSYEKDYSVSNDYDIGWIDDIFYFTQEEIYTYDFNLVNITGPGYLIGGEEYQYEVTVRNEGQFNVTGYTVNLVDGSGYEYDTETVYWMLPPGGERVVELTMSPEESVADTLFGLYGHCYFNLDENPENDYSKKYDIHIAGSDCHFAQIGEAETLTNLLPVNFRRYTSISETIYYADELEVTGAVTGIDIFNNFANPIAGIDLRIWLGETEMNSLLDGWISADSLQLVYDGQYDFPAGDNTLNIRLDDYYEYQGTNLVMLLEKGYEEGSHSWQSNFYYSEITGVEEGRTRFNYSDLGSFDPCSLQNGVLCDWLANTVFTISPIPYGHLAGYVYDEWGSAMNDAQVSVDEDLWTAESDSAGYFLIERIDTGIHQMQVYKEGYMLYGEEIEISSAEILEVEVHMQEEVDNNKDDIITSGAAISRIYPNPFVPGGARSNVQIELNLSDNDLPARVDIYDIRGRKVASREVNSTANMHWDGRANGKQAAAGIYLFKLITASSRTDTARLLLIK